MLRRLGVRGRLLLAFVGISAFAVIAAAAAMYSFAEVGAVLDRITRQRVPAALASLKLSRQAEQLVTAAPALLAVTSRSQQEEVSASIAAEVERLDQRWKTCGAAPSTPRPWPPSNRSWTGCGETWTPSTT